MRAIILNGATSSGKSSIAKAIQRIASEPFLHVCLDDIVDMFNWDAVEGEDLRGECHLVGMLNFNRALPIFLSSRFPVIIDHVFARRDWYDDCMSAVEGHPVLLAGIHCNLDNLRTRELARGDRRIGLAESQYSNIHKHLDYDVEVDTSVRGFDDCAIDILRVYKKLV